MEFIETIRAAGLTPPNIIEPEKLYRFPGIEKRSGNTAGWCKLFADVLGGVYGDFSQDFSASWQAVRSTPLSAAQRAAFNRQIAESKASADAEKAARQLQAATKAASIWRDAQPATIDNAYLARKRIASYGARLHKGALAIPVRDGATIHSLQFIGTDGEKRFLTDGRIRGCYFSIGTITDASAICIVEGFATGATVHEATGFPVAVAFNAGNLEAVALAIRATLPNMPIIVCADDDAATSGNPGITKATTAARAVGGKVAIPDFGDARPNDVTDFNDMATHCGLDAVKRAVASAMVPELETHQFSHNDGPASAHTGARHVTLQSAADITPEAIHWLWNGWLAAGKFHILGGAPGTGKTTLAIAFAATLSSAGRWPDGSKAEAGNVLIWSGEDDPANTLVPRLIASGANLERVKFVTGTEGSGGNFPFDPAKDMTELRDVAQSWGNVRLLIVDPVVSAVAGDSHKNADTRRSLQPLVDLGAALNCAVIGITHFSKGTAGRDPTERITGSIAFAALARVVMIAAKKEQVAEGKPSRMLARSKSNIGPDEGGFAYDLPQIELPQHPGVFTSHVVWGAAIEGTARDMLASADASDDADGTALGEAREFLNDLLANEPVSVKAVKTAASEAGISFATVKRAKKAIGVVAEKTAMNGGWVWKIQRRGSSNDEGAHQNNVSTFDKVEHLRESENDSDVMSEVF
jgi:putative DNA primase/helicase